MTLTLINAVPLYMKKPNEMLPRPTCGDLAAEFNSPPLGADVPTPTAIREAKGTRNL